MHDQIKMLDDSLDDSLDLSSTHDQIEMLDDSLDGSLDDSLDDPLDDSQELSSMHDQIEMLKELYEDERAFHMEVRADCIMWRWGLIASYGGEG